MKVQNYSNYKRFYIPHHFILLPLLVFLEIIGIKNIFYDKSYRLEWMLFSVSVFCSLYLAILLRQHYALGNQDRIVRLEFRLRYLELFGKPSKEVEQKLSFAQIKALRFASDYELPPLIERAIRENLSADKILKSIQNWQPDLSRV